MIRTKEIALGVTCLAIFVPPDLWEDGSEGQRGSHEEAPFSEEQMVKILREADTAPVMDVAKKHGISDQTIYLWRKKFGQLEPADVRKLRQLEQENAKLKKLVAERDLEIELMMRLLQKNGRRAGPASTGGISVPRRIVDSQSVRADVGGEIDVAIRVAAGEARCTCGHGDAGARGTVPAVRIPAHPGVPGAKGSCDERRSNPSAVETARPSGTEREASPARSGELAAAPGAERSEPGLGVRLSLRCLRERTAAEVSDGDR